MILAAQLEGDPLRMAIRWMQRRHPCKPLTWCYKMYFTSVGNRNYVLQGTIPDRRGKPRTIRLVKAMDVLIKRHVKIKATANPYDPKPTLKSEWLFKRK